MTVTYRTFVRHLPSTPMGLLPERWVLDHWCNACRQRVATDQLVAHARRHHGESFPPPSTEVRMGPEPMRPSTTEEVTTQPTTP
jgi:DNA-binding transcriptional regulator PaaX